MRSYSCDKITGVCDSSVELVGCDFVCRQAHKPFNRRRKGHSPRSK